MNKLAKFANVFDRLKADSKINLLQKIKDDPREANKIVNGEFSFQSYLAENEKV